MPNALQCGSSGGVNPCSSSDDDALRALGLPTSFSNAKSGGSRRACKKRQRSDVGDTAHAVGSEPWRSNSFSAMLTEQLQQPLDWYEACNVAVPATNCDQVVPGAAPAWMSTTLHRQIVKVNTPGHRFRAVGCTVLCDGGWLRLFAGKDLF